MQSRALSTEEGKDPANTSRTNQSRVLPLRLLQIFGLFLALCVAFSVISVYMIKRFGVSTTLTSPQSSFQPCYEEVGGLDRWIKPPSTLLHTMNDTELLWRASFAPKVKKYPFQRVPKVAFMFLTKGPLPLGPLWERFLKGHEGLYSIYIHSTPPFLANFPASSVFYRRQIPSKVGEDL